MSYPAPILNLNFTGAKQLHPAVAFSRASIGSYIDSSGILRYARTGTPRFDHDPLTGLCRGLRVEPTTIFLESNSSQLDNSWWIKSSATVTKNTRLSIDQSVSLDTCTASIGSVVLPGFFKPLPVAAGTNVEFSALVAKNGTSKLQLYVDGESGAQLFCIFDLDSGAVIQYGSSNGGTLAERGIEHHSGDIYKIWVFGKLATDSTYYFHFSILDANGNTSYTSDGSQSVYVGDVKIHTGSVSATSLPTGWETASTTANGIGTGTKTFTVGHNSTVAGQSIPTGATVLAWQTSIPANYLTGAVTAHTGTTLTLNITGSGGSGTGITDWTIQAGASVTRAADLCSVDLAKLLDGAGNPLWTGTEGTIVVDAIAPPTMIESFVLMVGDADNRISIDRKDGGTIDFYAYNGSEVSGIIHSPIVNASSRFKFCYGFANGIAKLSINGSTVSAATGLVIPSSLQTMWIGSLFGFLTWGGTFRSVQVYNRLISDTCFPALSAL